MKKIAIIIFSLACTVVTKAQVAVNDNGALPNASAMLDVNVNTPGAPKKGFLLPRVTEAQRTAMSNPAQGLTVYQTDGASGFYVNKSSIPSTPNWVILSEKPNFWSASLVNANDIFSSNTGDIGIGTSNPSPGKLHVVGTDNYTGYFTNTLASPFTHVLHAEYTGGNADAVAVYGKSKAADYYGIGGSFEGGYKGINATVLPSGANTYFGVYSNVAGGSGTNYGVYATVSGGTIDGSAGYFTSAAGNAIVTGTGNVGIGVSGALRAKLDVDGAVGAVSALFHSTATGPGIAIEHYQPGIGFNTYFNGGRKYIGTGYGAQLSFNQNNGNLEYFSTSASGTANNAAATSAKFAINASGNVGIGVSTANYKLDVNGRLHLAKEGIYGSGIWIDGPTVANNTFFGMEDDTNFGFYSGTAGGWMHHFDVADGTVRIGTSQKATGYMLNVGGKIISEEVRVQLKTSWPDYVFSKQYKLQPLEEVEKFIKENRHLPNMPSAVDVEKDGQMLGDVQRRLLEKVEELTLYVIDLKKEIELLKKK